MLLKPDHCHEMNLIVIHDPVSELIEKLEAELGARTVGLWEGQQQSLNQYLQATTMEWFINLAVNNRLKFFSSARSFCKFHSEEKKTFSSEYFGQHCLFGWLVDMLVTHEEADSDRWMDQGLRF